MMGLFLLALHIGRLTLNLFLKGDFYGDIDW